MSKQRQAMSVGYKARQFVSFTGASGIKQQAAERKAIKLFLAGTPQAKAIYQGFMFGIKFKESRLMHHPIRKDNELLRHCLKVLNELEINHQQHNRAMQFYVAEQPKWGA